MSDRRLIVGEFDPADANNGKLFALSPNTATGIALPSFQVGISRPAVGSTVGEGYFDLNQGQGFVWTGAAWKGIAPNPILTFTTEALLLADTTARPGVYATAGDTGSLFVRTPTGWRQVGVKQYPTATDLFGDAAAAVGALGEVMDEDSLWERTPAGWRLMLIREMANTAAIVAWTNTSPGATLGDRAVDKTTGITYIRISSGWRPITIYEDTEANIRATTWALNGQQAVATDTGRVFTRAAGAWVEEPIQHYATEAALLAATPQPGVMAWSDDTNVVFIRVAGAAGAAATWKRLQGPKLSYGTAAPATPSAADLWYDSDGNTGGLELYTGTAWIPAVSGAVAVGSIQQSILNTTQFATAMGPDAANWVLADGRAVPGTKYATITGQTNVPDLRGAFIRGAGTNGSGWAGGAAGSSHEWTTGRPKVTDFTGVTNASGDHHHTETASPFRGTASGHFTWEGATPAGDPRTTSDAGNHTHTVTVNGGGDAETAPVHISLNTFIRVN